MKVCILTPEFLPMWGGVGAYCYQLARELSGKAEVHVLTANGGHIEESCGVSDGIEVHSALRPDGSAKEVSPFQFQLGVLRDLPRLMQDHKFDIVHANHAYMSDILARLRRSSAANVVTVHTTLDTQIFGTRGAGSDSPRQIIEDRVSRWRHLLTPLEGYYLRRTPSLIFVSKWIRARAKERYGITPRFSAVVPNGVDTGLFSPTARGSRPDTQIIPTGSPTLLFAGRLLAQKGIALLFQAMASLGRDAGLLVAGPGEQEAWRSLAHCLGLTPERCGFLGAVPYARMPSLYRQVSAVVLPSYAESCPMVALEAMASGTPIIAADVGGVSEIVRDEETGWLFPRGDIVGLIDRIDTVLSDRARAQRVCERARRWVEDFATVDRMGDQTFQFYERILREGAS